MSESPTPERHKVLRRINDALFGVLGPAELGDPDEPPAKPAPAAGPCSGCGKDMAEHTFVDTEQGRRMRCPH